MKTLHTIYISLLLLVTGAEPVAAQSFFNRLYTNNAYSSMYYAITKHGTGWIVVAKAEDSATGKVGVKSIRMNADGKEESSGFFALPDYPGRDAFPEAKTITEIHNNCYVISGAVLPNYSSTSTPQYSFLLMVDSNGKTLKYRDVHKEECTTYDSFMYNAAVRYDGQGHILLAGHVHCGIAYYKFQLTKLDTALNTLWTKAYEPGTFISRSVNELIVEPDGYVICGGAYNGTATYSLSFRCQAMMLKTDTAGNEQWTYTSPAGQYYSFISHALHTSDGGYVYTATGHAYNKNPVSSGILDLRAKTLVVKLDAARNLLWEEELENHYTGFATLYRKFYELPDSTVIFSGGTSDSIAVNKLVPYIFLSRYARSGHLISKRKYPIPLDSGYVAVADIYDMTRTDDSSYVLAGYIQNYTSGAADPTIRGWLIKVDSNGCMGAADPQCDPTVIPPVQLISDRVDIYPNPSTADFDISYRLERPALLVVTDMLGKEVLSLTLPAAHSGHSNIRAGSWPAGMYLYKVIQEGQVLQRAKLIRN